MNNGPPKFFSKNIDNNLVEQVFGERKNIYANHLKIPKTEYYNDFENWFPKLKNFKPKYFLIYVGINDSVIMSANKIFKLFVFIQT